ncbi:MAG: AMP-binding protein [Alphaproteobacteria bacterium]|nr:AMP-binding protein [Alphaproteobacteria bacterium]
MTEYYDELEIRDPGAREAALMAALPDAVANAKTNAPGFTKILGDITPGEITTREALARLPVTRKSDLIEMQAAQPPFGGLTTIPAGEMARLYVSPGPIADPEGRGADWWRFARALFAAGFRKGDIVQNCFSYHFTPAGAMFESAAHALGCAVCAGGVGQTEMQIQAIAHFGASGYAGTPDFLKIILDKAREMGTPLPTLKRALVSGGALLPPLRKEVRDQGINVLQCYGSADLGLIAYESDAMEGMILDEGIIVEILRPGTGDPVPDGEVGEVVVTTLNRDYPLIRFATGDLSAIMAGVSPCGRTAPRIKGWMGRADQTTKIRGMFVHPAQIDRVVKRHPEISRARLVVGSVDGKDSAEFFCEAENSDESLAKRISDSIQAEIKVRAEVRIVTKDKILKDGVVIEDTRKYD